MMKITIDTKEDSPEEIAKILEVLNCFVSRGASTLTSRSTPASALGGLFNDSSKSEPSAQVGRRNSAGTASVLDALFGPTEAPAPTITRPVQNPQNQPAPEPVPRIRVMQY